MTRVMAQAVTGIKAQGKIREKCLNRVKTWSISKIRAQNTIQSKGAQCVTKTKAWYMSMIKAQCANKSEAQYVTGLGLRVWSRLGLRVLPEAELSR